MLFGHFLRNVSITLLLKLQFWLQVVLAVGLVYVLRQRAVLWEEEQGYVKCLGVERLTVFLGDELHVQKVFLKDEPDFCGNAEVA